MLEPYKGRVYDPAMGSGGFFVQSEQFITAHKGKIGDVSIYGQEYNHTTWQLAAMNMAIRGIDFNFGKEPANTYTNDQHPDLRADFVMANPPFNMKEWDTGVDDNDPRWVYGKPPSGNANFAWLQHMLYHLAPNGSLGLLLANGSMSSNTSGEGDIRKALDRKRLSRMHGRATGATVHQHANSRLHLVPHQKQKRPHGGKWSSINRPQEQSAVHRCAQSRLHERPRATRLHPR
jgi:type I restriction-modification system DNA methylase subunit